MTDSRCPMCGKTNPDDLEECRHCGARLRPLLASTPPEESRPPSRPEPPEPTKPPEPEPVQEDSGDWLDDLRDEVVKGTDELGLTGALDPTRLEPPPKRPPPKPGEEGTPEWLQRLRKKRESQPEAVEPDIEPLAAPEEPPLPTPEPSSETPTWLEHFREAEEPEEDVPEETPPVPRPRSGGGLRERLAAVEREDEPPEILPPVEIPSFDIDEVPSEAFETLPGLSARAAFEEPEQEAGLPDWLSEPAPEPEPPSEVPAEALETKDIPGMSFQDQDPAPAETGLPDWLQDLKPDLAPPPELPPDEAPIDIPPEALETKDIPGLGFQAEEGAEQADLPSWLKDLAPEDELPVGPPSEDLPAEPAEEQTLDWLPEIADERVEPPAEALETKDIPELSFQASEISPEEISPAEDVPEWLQGLAPEAPPEVSEPIIPGLPPEPAGEIKEPEPAAWPPEPTIEDVPSEALETRDIPGLSFKADAEVPELEAAGDLPDWLQDVQAETPDSGLLAESPAEPSAPEDFPEITFDEGEEEDAAPGWLLGLEAEAAEAAAAADAVETTSTLDTPLVSSQPADEEHKDILPELDVGPPEGEVPEWLAAAAAAVPSSGPLVLPEEEQEEPLTLDVPAEPAEALPDWLQDAGPPPEGEELPDLDAMPEPMAVEPEIEEELTPLEDEIPPWMSDEGVEAVLPPVVGVFPETEDAVSESPILEEETPDWLQPAEVERESAVSLEQEDLPDWLQGLQAAQEQAIPESELHREPESPVDLEAAEPSEAVPPWLAELRAKTTEAPMIGEFEDEPEEVADIPLQVGVEPQLDGVVPGELPDWISEISPERAGQVEIEGAEGLETPKVEDGAELEPAELPGWLKAMRPVEAVTPLSPSAEAMRGVEGVGPLAGLQGILPAEPEISQAGRPPSFSMRVEVTQNQYEHVEKLKTLLEEEAESQAVGPRWGVVQPQHVLRWIILGVLLLAVGIPLAFGFQQNDLPTLVPEETLEVGNLVLGLPLNARVLVSFDYQPGLSGEMDAAAEAVIDHMIRLRQVEMVLVSTNTSGPALAERFLSDPLGVGQHTFAHGENYVNLGYIPGGAAGLIDFATTPRRVFPIPFNLQNVPETSGVWGVPLLADVGTVADFDLVLVVVDDASTARAWVEQVEPRLEGVPLVMVSSAQAAPMILPYFRTDPRQVDGMISGLPGAVSYLRINEGANLARPYWDAFGNGLLIAALLIVVGGFISVSANVLQSTQPGSIEELQ